MPLMLGVTPAPAKAPEKRASVSSLLRFCPVRPRQMLLRRPVTLRSSKQKHFLVSGAEVEEYAAAVNKHMAISPAGFAALAVAPLLLLLLLLPDAAEPRVLLSVDDFGAVGDGIADDTQALLDAWNAACATLDKTVLNVPAGRSYQVWPVTLAGPCREEIKLFISGSIVAPESPDEWERRDGEKWLHFYRVQDLSVSGGGVIDGRGQQWWEQSCKGRRHSNDKHCTPQAAPKAVHFEECHGVRVQGVSVQNSQQQHLTFTRCTNARASFLRVSSPETSPATDGIHLVDSKNVQLADNLISTGGDCVSMVGNCTDVRLRSISCGPGSGISIGTIGETPAADRLEKIEIDTVFMTNTSNGVRIKTWQDGCGYARKVKFQSIAMKNVSNPIVIDQYRTSSHPPVPCGAIPGMSAVAVEKIDYEGIAGTSATRRAVTFACSVAVPCRRVSLRNVNLTLVAGHGHRAPSAYCRAASGKSTGVVVPESCLATLPRLQGDDAADDYESE